MATTTSQISANELTTDQFASPTIPANTIQDAAIQIMQQDIISKKQTKQEFQDTMKDAMAGLLKYPQMDQFEDMLVPAFQQVISQVCQVFPEDKKEDSPAESDDKVHSD